MRAFAWKEVSTETLPDSCPDPLLFLLFSRRFPALSLLLGLLRFHKIEQLLFRVDLKLGIENAAHASTRAARTACLTTTDNPDSSVGLALGSGVYAGNVINEYRGQTQKLRFLRYPSFNPSHTRKDQPSGWSFLSVHANGSCAFSSATNSQRRARFRCAGQPRGRA